MLILEVPEETGSDGVMDVGITMLCQKHGGQSKSYDDLALKCDLTLSSS